MNRFRFTLLAVSLVLTLLGLHDLKLWISNPSPLSIGIADLQQGRAPREWLRIEGGIFDLPEAISTSGTIELEAFLVPLRDDLSDRRLRVLVETRDPEIMNLMQKWAFGFDTEKERRAYLEANRDRFYPRRTVTGMVVGGLIASGNRDRLTQLARELGLEVDDQVIFISEGKQPPRWRGLFFLVVGLTGLVRGVQLVRRGKSV
ncbi:MAG: hypothetical protein D6751_02920 [Deltaproteobacteria bacterium]|nr:MAG: hypothetical protein D6751_02920 [Deltaproteobacteria bacterium]